MPSLGIDIGGSSVKVSLLDQEKTLTARSEGYHRPSREELLHAIRSAISGLSVHIDHSVPVGLCLPGKRSAGADRIERSVNLPCIEGWGFDELLKSSLGSSFPRVSVVSDIHAAAIDLVYTNRLSGRVAVVAIGTGVGLGVWENGQMLSIGERGIGHLGQVDVGRLGDTDRFGADGARNTLESYIGLAALRSRFSEINEAKLLDRIRELPANDPAVRSIVHALRIVHAIYAPDAIVLAGGVGIALAPMGDELHKRVSDGLTSLASADWTLRFGDSLFHASRGAARLALG